MWRLMKDMMKLTISHLISLLVKRHTKVQSHILSISGKTKITLSHMWTGILAKILPINTKMSLFLKRTVLNVLLDCLWTKLDSLQLKLRYGKIKCLS
jgi:hypothetical protein